MRAKKFGNSIYQTHVSRFSVRNWTFKTADEFSPSHLFLFTISTDPLDSPVHRPGSFLWHGVAVSNEFFHYSISSHLPFFWGHKRHPLEQMPSPLHRSRSKSVSSLGHFWKLRVFVIWIFWVNFPVKTVRIDFSEFKMHAVFTRKKSNFLANMTRNSRQVLLPREMV